jgi:hypothetical protein
MVGHEGSGSFLTPRTEYLMLGIFYFGAIMGTSMAFSMTDIKKEQGAKHVRI